jgi:hypothetical protein
MIRCYFGETEKGEFKRKNKKEVILNTEVMHNSIVSGSDTFWTGSGPDLRWAAFEPDGSDEIAHTSELIHLSAKHILIEIVIDNRNFMIYQVFIS